MYREHLPSKGPGIFLLPEKIPIKGPGPANFIYDRVVFRFVLSCVLKCYEKKKIQKKLD